MRKHESPSGPSAEVQITVLISVAVAVILFMFGYQAFYAAPIEITSVTVKKTVVSEENPELVVNLNTATKEELCELPGIGDVLASRIVAYREENGDFPDIYALMNVEGISQSLFLKLEDMITV